MGHAMRKYYTRFHLITFRIIINPIEILQKKKKLFQTTVI